VFEDVSEPDAETRYFDGIKQSPRRKVGYFSGKIQAVSYPEAFYQSVLLQRRPRAFGFSYRVPAGEGYKIHLVYNVSVAPSAVAYKASGFADAYTWEFSSQPVPVVGFNRTAHLIVDANDTYEWAQASFEDILYGTSTTDPRLPAPDEVREIFESYAVLQIIDNGDGTWTAISDDRVPGVLTMLDPDTYQISWTSAIYLDSDSYTLSTL
jgi:hypothetical protein